MISITTTSEQETAAVAQQLATTLAGGEVLALHGDLGAGKTTFVKALAAALGATTNVTSPTFTVMRPIPTTHSTIRELIHVDAYRLESGNQALAIGLGEYLSHPQTICAIEWPDHIADILPPTTRHIYFTHVNPTTRHICEK